MKGSLGLVVAGFVALLIFMTSTRETMAYEVPTHVRITEAAVLHPDVVQLLRDALGLAGGPSAIVRGKTVVSMITNGVEREDDAFRYLSHFHNPLATWDQSGLQGAILGFPVGPFEASVLWAQNTSNEWSGDRVQLARVNALTGQTRQQREDALIYLFRGLGQLVHLIQDAASPGHTRNDPHVGGNYEKLVRDLHTLSSAATDPPLFGAMLTYPIGPDPGWRGLPSNPLASPSNTVAKLIDGELYQAASYYVGTNPAVTLDTRIGLAEYTNANFLSEDSTWESQWFSLPRPFRYPARPSTIVASNICEEYSGPKQPWTDRMLKAGSSSITRWSSSTVALWEIPSQAFRQSATSGSACRAPGSGRSSPCRAVDFHVASMPRIGVLWEGPSARETR